MTSERKAENKLIDELKKVGLFAYHLDSNSVNGLPDVDVIGKRIIKIEVKYGPSGGSYPVLLKNILQASQPIYWDAARQAHSHDIYLCVVNAEGRYSLYETSDVLLGILRGNTATERDLRIVSVNGSPCFTLEPRDMAHKIKELCDRAD